MKCDELKAYKGDVTIPVYGTIADAEVYLKDKADEALSEKDHEIARLNTEIKEAVKTMKSQDVEIMELKKKLENVQATAYAESVDAGMRERRLRRALWISRAYFCGRSSEYFSGMASRCKIGQEDFYKEVSERAQRYLKASYKCRAKAKEYK